MEEEKRENQHRRAENYLRNIGDRYIFDPTSGIYSHKSASAEEEREHEVAITDIPEVDVFTGPLSVTSTKDWWDRSLIFVSFLTLILLVATVHYTRKQWEETRRMEGIARTANQQAWSANNRSLEAANASNEISAMALKDVQRAFVFPVPEVDVAQSADKTLNFGYRVSMRFENSGTTPAKHVITHVSNDVLTNSPKDIGYPELWDKNVEHINVPSFVSPHGSISSTTAPIISEAEAKMTNAPNLARYFWGYVRYQDVFGSSKEHITEFCFSVKGFFEPPINGVVKGWSVRTANCPEHNCYDDDCKVK